MKRALFGAAAGALGALGAAGLMAAAPAQAACGEPTTPPLERANCLVSQDLATFGESISPGYNIGVLLNGNEDNPDLGLLDQPATFARSLQDFAAGPVSAGGPSPVDTTAPGTPPA